MAEKALEIRPPPDELTLFALVIPIYALMSSMSGTFVQVAFSQNLGVSAVVAIVGNGIAPTGLRLIRRYFGLVAPKVAMLASVFAMLAGLALALIFESLLVMIWGFTSSSAAINLTIQYVEDLMTMKGASGAERDAWKARPFLQTCLGALLGFLLGPCLFSGLWHSQACGLAVMLLPLPWLLRLPSPVSTYQAPPSWSYDQLRKPKVLLCLACLLLQVCRNLCRETLLGPSITWRNYVYEFQMDYWNWGQLNFLAAFGGMIGFICSKDMAPSPVFVVVVMVLSQVVFTAELTCTSFRELMVANFAGALLRHFSAPLLWRLFQDVIGSEEQQVLAQALGFFEIAVSYVAPMLCGAIGFQGFGTSFLNFLGTVLILMAVSLPKGKAD